IYIQYLYNVNMSLEYSLLGFLNFGPMTGYDLKKTLDESTQFFWHAELSQIYPELKSLEQKGSITSETLPQDGKPDKKIYSITSKGKEELRAWLSDPLDEAPVIKNKVLLKLFFSGILKKEEICSQLRCQLEIQHALLKRFQQESATRIKSAAQAKGMDNPALMWDLVRRYGEAQAEMTVHWLEETLNVVEKTMKS
ncbi:MAG TPA: PadR family transcriptional regulator, partial [Longilinea sp.]|nr:PadR family transcriptional regulator [Longilinea sp.]